MEDVIYETEDFVAKAANEPHLDREDGGHVVILPRERFAGREELNPRQAKDLMRMTMVVGEAMKKVMNEHGVDVGILNYQDNKNWSVFNPEGPYLHIHILGRAKSAKGQKYGESLVFPNKKDNPGFYESLKKLTDEDVVAMREEVKRLLDSEKYLDENWF